MGTGAGWGEPRYDVVVVGAGNAALCAALAAREQGASVLVLEKASRPEQGGNCPFTGGGFRFVHDGIDDLRDLLPGLTDRDAGRLSMEPYTADDFRRHLTEVTLGETDGRLMEVLVSESRPTVDWMHAQGVEWELPSGGHRSSAAPSVVPNSVGLAASGSGPGLVRMLTAAARRAGIELLYETRMAGLRRGRDGEVSGVEVEDADGTQTVGCSGVVLACGGFEASAEMRRRHLGDGWERARVRGSRHNTGDGHIAALEAGAQPAGQWAGCHATPIDADAPPVGDLRAHGRPSPPLLSPGDHGEPRGRTVCRRRAGVRRAVVRDHGEPHPPADGRRGLPDFRRQGPSAPRAQVRGERAGRRRTTQPDLLGGSASSRTRSPERSTGSTRAAHRAGYEPGRLDGRSTTGLRPYEVQLGRDARCPALRRVYGPPGASPILMVG